MSNSRHHLVATQPLFGGQVTEKEINGWTVSWEAVPGYRFWCYQKRELDAPAVAVVMLNPGSLSGSGENLNRDTTLRILREIFDGTGCNTYVVNLFNFATPKPSQLFSQWEKRDHHDFSYPSLPLSHVSAVLYAYGDYEFRKDYSGEIRSRICEVRDAFSGIPEITGVKRNKSGAPKHPLPIQRQKLKSEFQQAIYQQVGARFPPIPQPKS